MTLVERLHALGLRREAEGLYTDQNICEEAVSVMSELLDACQLLERAEHNRQFCDECEDEGEPEACSKCFPAFDDARVKRRLAIAKATNSNLSE
jgi:hypothetical protein